MLGSVRIPTAVLLALTAGTAFAQKNGQPGPQNSDFSFLLGSPLGGSSAVASNGTRATTSPSYCFQSAFAHTVHSFTFGDLWFEVPSTTEDRPASNADIDYSAFYVTLGARLTVPLGSRWSFYGATGGGYVEFTADERLTPDGKDHSLTNFHGAFDVGLGIDFRLTRLLSIRGESRDYVTGRGLGGVAGRNHVIALFGLAVHL